MNTTLARASKALAVSAVTALALTGCIKVDFDLELQSDDTVDGAITYAVAEGTGEFMSTEDQEYTDEEAAEALFGDLAAEDYENGEVTTYAEDDWVGKTVTFEGETLDGFALDEGSEGLTIVREGDEFVVSGPYDASGELGEAPAGAEMTLSITFPGAVSESNGEISEDGRTVTWNLLDAPETIDARGAAVAGGSMPWLIPALIVAGVLALGAVALALVLMRRRPEAAVEPAPYVAAPEAGTAFAPAEGPIEPVIEPDTTVDAEAGAGTETEPTAAAEPAAPADQPNAEDDETEDKPPA